jgi:hypothetical protein
MISPFFRNDTVEIVVPNNKFRVNASLWKNQKIYWSVVNESHPSTDQGGGKWWGPLLRQARARSSSKTRRRAITASRNNPLEPIEQVVEPNRQHLEITIVSGESVAAGKG